MRSGIMRLCLVCLGLCALIACERPAAPEPVAPEPVTPGEELGGFTAPVEAIAFWAHPTLAFNGMALTLSGGALQAFNIEDGVEVARAELISNSAGDKAPAPTMQGRLAVGYEGTGLSAKALAVAMTGGGENAALSFFAIDNISRALPPLSDQISPLLNAAGLQGADLTGLCLGKDGQSQALTLYLLSPETITSLALSIEGDVVAAPGLQSRTVPAGLTHCAVDVIDGAVFAADGRGTIYRFAPGEEAPNAFAKTGIEQSAGLALSFSGLTFGGPTEECCGQLSVIDGPSGVLHVFDRDDGAKLGAALIGASFDIEATASVTAMAVGSGNFGGTLRNGVMAVATTGTDGAPVIRFAPWSGVLNALQAPFGDAYSPRGEEPASDEGGVTIDLDIFTQP